MELTHVVVARCYPKFDESGNERESLGTIEPLGPTFRVIQMRIFGSRSQLIVPIMAALAAFGLSAAQRSLSTPARLLRRRTLHVTGTLTMADGAEREIDRTALLTPLERALNAMSASVVLFATALAISRLT